MLKSRILSTDQRNGGTRSVAALLRTTEEHVIPRIGKPLKELSKKLSKCSSIRELPKLQPLTNVPGIL